MADTDPLNVPDRVEVNLTRREREKPRIVQRGAPVGGDRDAGVRKAANGRHRG